MIIAVGTDHAGFALKETVVATIAAAGHEVLDCGAYTVTPGDDYPDFAAAVARAILDGRADRGVLLCGSGVGASVAANKFDGIRSGLCHDTFSARQGVEDDAMNVLALGARVLGPALATELVNAFLGAEFSGAERHRRRLEKIQHFEHEHEPSRARNSG
ncbi:MAG TPA: ribose 5-phosphate isomerase B [Gemmatimonadaceae bacterium]|nr:ribose 5-phosphate isomerase B [Gemmatimonadaceae bacterium]